MQHNLFKQILFSTFTVLFISFSTIAAAGNGALQIENFSDDPVYYTIKIGTNPPYTDHITISPMKARIVPKNTGTIRFDYNGPTTEGHSYEDLAEMTIIIFGETGPKVCSYSILRERGPMPLEVGGFSVIGKTSGCPYKGGSEEIPYGATKKLIIE